ncbi:MAG: translation elongation factor Ts [Pseudomonadota bacterium]
MADITAALVKDLRAQTGAGMLDCKRALVETGGDMETAFDWLRKKGLAAAAKKAGRVAAEGLVGVHLAGQCGAMVEVNSETDFVARNDAFQEFVRAVGRAALEQGGDIEALLRAAYPGGGGTVADRLVELAAKIGENMTLRRSARLAVGEGVVASYVHNAAAPGLGKIGVLVALESTGDTAQLRAFGKQLAMHVAAANPQALGVADIDPLALARERAILHERATASGKPAAVIDKMVEGRLRKYYEEVALLEQLYVIDGEARVQAAVERAAKEVGAPIRVAAFRRFAVGEGIWRKDSDCVADVAAMRR